MSPRSIRRAQEHKARKLAYKAERALERNRASEEGTKTHSADLIGEPSPEIYDEFSPELIAEANAARERVHRRAGLLPPSQRDALPSRRQLDPEPETSATHTISSAQPLSEPRTVSGVVSPAQLAANRANSQHSTGATSPEGKQTVSLNAFRHGLAGRFLILPHESENEFKELFHGLQHEHRPSTPTEHLLIEGMAQHYWLAHRALNLQQLCFDDSGIDEKQLALYLRYQSTHDRGFHKCLNDLLKLRAQKRREEIGFVSQQHKQADQARREAIENRKRDRHGWAVLLDSAKLDHQNLMNLQLPGGQPFVHKAIQRTIALEKSQSSAA